MLPPSAKYFPPRLRRASEKRFTVCEDLRLTAECAAHELLQLGCRHYAFVPFPRTRYWSEERARHFREIVRL
jgi:DNA-binding LacI/PurR family transcriptional regulator